MIRQQQVIVRGLKSAALVAIGAFWGFAVATQYGSPPSPGVIVGAIAGGAVAAWLHRSQGA